MNVLGVGSHFDDLELGCSGTLIKHVNNGDRVIMLVITNSSYKNHSDDLVRDGDVAYKEGVEAANIIGAELICMSYETFFVPFEDSLTKEINRYIEERDIDIIYCPWVHDLHRDHHYAAKNTLMAGRHVPRFREGPTCDGYGVVHTWAANLLVRLHQHDDRQIRCGGLRGRWRCDDEDPGDERT